MKNTHDLLLMFVVFGYIVPLGAFGKTCNSGEFLFTKDCQSCPVGCYCEGSTSVQLDPDNKITSEQLKAWCKGGTECPKPTSGNHKDEYQACGRNGKVGVNRCPADFPGSAPGTTKISDCYVYAGAKQLFYRTVSCPAGQYLPINSDTCVNCTTGAGDYCPGVQNIYPSRKTDQGLKVCSYGQVANSAHTACDTQDASNETVNCIAGTYLPANTNACVACKDKTSGFICAGANSLSRAAIDQGIEKCPDNSIPNYNQTACETCPKGQGPNSDYTECVDAGIEVPAGMYLPANAKTADKATPCRGANKFCPGGFFYQKSEEQGRYDCPYNSKPVEPGHEACDVRLTKEQLKSGILGKGKSECWTMVDIEDYKACVFGLRIEK